VFESRVQRTVFGHWKDEVADDSRKLLNEEVYNSHCSPDVIKMIRSRTIGLMGRVAGTGEVRNP
jgi:hypothetical protein